MIAVLTIGIVLFFGTHFIPRTPFKQRIIATIGEKPYRGIFSLASLLGLTLMIVGFGYAEHIPLWEPILPARHITFLLMPFAMIFVVSGFLNGKIRRRLKHPMLIGIALWSIVHLPPNGDLASTMLFTAFLLYSLPSIIFIPSAVPSSEASLSKDGIAIGLGLALYAAMLHGHQYIIGVAIIP